MYIIICSTPRGLPATWSISNLNLGLLCLGVYSPNPPKCSACIITITTRLHLRKLADTKRAPLFLKNSSNMKFVLNILLSSSYHLSHNVHICEKCISTGDSRMLLNLSANCTHAIVHTINLSKCLNHVLLLKHYVFLETTFIVFDVLDWSHVSLTMPYFRT